MVMSRNAAQHVWRRDEEEFSEWQKANAQFLAWMHSAPAPELVRALQIAYWQARKTAAAVKVEKQRLENTAVDLAAMVGEAVGKNHAMMEKVAPNLVAFHKSIEGLASGRPKGALSQKKHAAAIWKEVMQINADLLLHPDTARWGIHQRAEYITVWLRDHDRLQLNGNQYQSATIARKIAGTG